MAKYWGNKKYDIDFFEIDEGGNRLSDQKDLGASEGWTNYYEPWRNSPGWHAQPLSPEQEAGIKDTNPTGYNERMAWRSANPGAFQAPPQTANPWAGFSMPSFPSFPSFTPSLPPATPNTPSKGTSSASGTGGDARSQIANAYQQFLGRAASPEEIEGWYSGAYGHGSGDAGLSAILAAIQNSDEARQRGGSQPPILNQNPDTNHPYTPPQPTEQAPPYQNLDWWSARGVPQSEMFDLTTGQLKPGWQRTARGYERTTNSVPGPQGGNFQAWFQQLTNGKRISPKTLKELEPVLNQYGIKLGPLNARGFTDGIILPDGTFIDVIIGATEDGGQGWGWMIPPPGGGGAPQMPPTQFNDPHTNYLEQLLQQMIQSRMQPIVDPNRAMYEAMLKQRAEMLGRLSPELDKQIAYLEERFKDLQGSGYTGAEGEAIRTGALDPIEQDRKAARDRVLQRLSARGLDLNSGIAQQALLEVDKVFDSMRGTTQTALTTNDLNRREDRKTRAETIRNTLSQIPEGRAREQLDVVGMLNQLSALTRQENESRQREAVGYGGALADLGPQRLQLAMQAAGMGGSPSSMFQNLMQLAQLNQNSSLYGMQNSNSLWNGLGSIAAMLYGAGR